MPGRERAAEELAVGADHVEVRRRSEVDDHARPAVQRVGRQGVDDPVGTDLLGVVIEERYARPGARLHDHDLHVLVPALEDLAQLAAERPARWSRRRRR